jgi:hypothetical protein
MKNEKLIQRILIAIIAVGTLLAALGPEVMDSFIGSYLPESQKDKNS